MAKPKPVHPRIFWGDEEAAAQTKLKERIRALPKIKKLKRATISPIKFAEPETSPSHKKAKTGSGEKRGRQQPKRHSPKSTGGASSFHRSIFERVGPKAFDPKPPAASTAQSSATQTDPIDTEPEAISQSDSALRRRRRARASQRSIEDTLRQAKREDLIVPSKLKRTGRVDTSTLRQNFQRLQSEIRDAALRPLRNKHGHLLPVDVVYNKPPPPVSSNKRARNYKEYRLIKEAQIRRASAKPLKEGEGAATKRKPTRPAKVATHIRPANIRSAIVRPAKVDTKIRPANRNPKESHTSKQQRHN